MHVEVRLNENQLRRWHLDLLRALAGEDGVVATVRWSAPRAPRPPASVERLLSLERTVNRLPSGPSTREAPAAFHRYVVPSATAPALVLDLSGDAQVDDAATWTLTFNGSPHETGVLAALMSGQFPTVRVVDVATGIPLVSGRPGSEMPGVIAAAFDDVLARCVDLVIAAVRGGSTTSIVSEAAGELTMGRTVGQTGKALARAAARRIYHLLYRAPHWRVGWRFVDGPDVLDLGAHPPSGWQSLPDDGYHFYADPFPVSSAGAVYLFVEDYDHRVGRAAISVVPFDEKGPVGSPRQVLAKDSHMSYPFVLADQGQHWMIPETSAAGTVELYRATRFPDEWTLEEVLLDDVQACDATPFRHHGRWWLSATVSHGGSSSDALHLWSAQRLQGPWRPHARNPVLVDIGCARPAGRVVTRAGRLVRPFQDCRGGYGAALGFAEIVRLDDETFEQRVLARIGPGPSWPGLWLHTLNRAGPLECIDGSGYSLRLGRASSARLLALPKRAR